MCVCVSERAAGGNVCDTEPSHTLMTMTVTAHSARAPQVPGMAPGPGVTSPQPDSKAHEVVTSLSLATDGELSLGE